MCFGLYTKCGYNRDLRTKKMHLYFDKMQLSDLEAVVTLENNNYEVPWSKGVIKDCIKSDYHSVVLKQDGAIIAYAFVMTACDEAHLLNMCVDKSSQSMGLGRKMLHYIENLCRYNRCQLLLLEVRVSNTVAQGLYRSFAFETIGIRKNYYRCRQGREHALVMQKKLT